MPSPTPSAPRAPSAIALSLTLSLALSLTLSPPRSAWAHHPSSPYGVSSAAPQSLLELDTRLGSYGRALDGVGGRWWQSSLRTEVAVLERLSVMGSLPYATLLPREGAARTGIGDAGLALKGTLWRPQHGRAHLSASLGAELPTGDEGSGLGGGHLALGPALSFNADLSERVVLFGGATLGLSAGSTAPQVETRPVMQTLQLHHTFTLDGVAPAPAAGVVRATSEAGAHGSVIAPHSGQELGGSLGLAYLRAWGYVSATWTAAEPLAPLLDPALPSARSHSASLEVGWTPTPALRVAAGFDAPTLGAPRFEARARLGVAYWL